MNFFSFLCCQKLMCKHYLISLMGIIKNRDQGGIVMLICRAEPFNGFFMFVEFPSFCLLSCKVEVRTSPFQFLSQLWCKDYQSDAIIQPLWTPFWGSLREATVARVPGAASLDSCHSGLPQAYPGVTFP